MARQFLTITQDEIDLKLAEAIRSRELELLAYDLELETHQSVANQAITNDVTVRAAYMNYRGLPRDQMIANAMRDGKQEIITQISALDSIERAQHGVQAVLVETAKSEKFLEQLLSKLPEERREAAFAALRQKEEEEKAARLK